MGQKNIIVAWLKAFPCLIFVVALGLTTPSASHSLAGFHSPAHGVAISSHTDAQHENLGHHSALHAGEDDVSVGQCCSGICVSLALCEVDVFSATVSADPTYETLQSASYAIEPRAFLRPPRPLI
jgi:hypothetical protein